VCVWNAWDVCGTALTDNLAGRKVALSFSNKATDAAFAKELHAALKVAGCECRLLTKWPVNGWVQACVWAADEADFCIVLNSANYNEGHYSVAERYMIKESNVPHIVFELDTPGHADYVGGGGAAEAMALIAQSLPLTQGERCDTNTCPSTLSSDKLLKEDREAYAKLTKVWTPKEGSHDAMKIDLDKLADEQLKVAAERAAAAERATAGEGAGSGGGLDEAKEEEELKELFSRR